MLTTVNPKYEHLRTWIESMPQIFTQEGKCLFKGRNEVRRLTAPDGTEVCVKRYGIPSLPQRFAYTYIRAPKAQRAYSNALRLIASHIPTPEPIAYMIVKSARLLSDSYLVTTYCPYPRNFYEFRGHGIEGHEPIIRQLAYTVADMHMQHIYHKDLSPGNLLFDISNGRVQLTIIDINRMAFPSATIGIKQACRNFARLWGNDDFFMLLAECYAEKRGFSVALTQQLTLRYHRRYWRFRK